MTDRTKIDCQNCGNWGFDMDLEPFCVHPNASPIGTDCVAMRGTKRTRHMRGEPCGPKAQFFKQGHGIYAATESNA